MLLKSDSRKVNSTDQTALGSASLGSAPFSHKFTTKSSTNVFLEKSVVSQCKYCVQNQANGLSNSADPDQTAPEGTV